MVMLNLNLICRSLLKAGESTLVKIRSWSSASEYVSVSRAFDTFCGDLPWMNSRSACMQACLSDVFVALQRLDEMDPQQAYFLPSTAPDSRSK